MFITGLKIRRSPMIHFTWGPYKISNPRYGTSDSLSALIPSWTTQLSGHKNLKSIDNYSNVSIQQQKAMSVILSEKITGSQRQVLAPLNRQMHEADDTSTSRATSSIGADSVKCGMFSGATFNRCTFVLGDSRLPKRRREDSKSSDEDE